MLRVSEKLDLNVVFKLETLRVCIWCIRYHNLVIFVSVSEIVNFLFPKILRYPIENDYMVIQNRVSRWFFKVWFNVWEKYIYCFCFTKVFVKTIYSIIIAVNYYQGLFSPPALIQEFNYIRIFFRIRKTPFLLIIISFKPNKLKNSDS